MKTNTVIIILSVALVVSLLFGFMQKVKADQSAEEAIKQSNLKEEARVEAIESQSRSQTAQVIVEDCRIYSDSLRAQLFKLQEKCK